LKDVVAARQHRKAPREDHLRGSDSQRSTT